MVQDAPGAIEFVAHGVIEKGPPLGETDTETEFAGAPEDAGTDKVSGKVFVELITASPKRRELGERVMLAGSFPIPFSFVLRVLSGSIPSLNLICRSGSRLVALFGEK